MSKVPGTNSSKDEIFRKAAIQLSLFDDDGEVLVVDDNDDLDDGLPADEYATEEFYDAEDEAAYAAIGELDFTEPPTGDLIHGAKAAEDVLAGKEPQAIQLQKSGKEQEFLEALDHARTSSDAYEIAMKMVDAGCDFSEKHAVTGMTALHYTASLDSLSGTTEILEAIKQIPQAQSLAIINATDNDGVTALGTTLFYSASGSTQSEFIAKALLQAGADFQHIKENEQNAHDALRTFVESLRKTQQVRGNISDGNTLLAMQRVLQDMDERAEAIVKTQQSAAIERSSQMPNVMRAALALRDTALDADDRPQRLAALLRSFHEPDANINERIEPATYQRFIAESDDSLPQRNKILAIEDNPNFQMVLRYLDNELSPSSALRLGQGLMTMDAQSIFRRRLNEEFNEDQQQHLLSTLTKYINASDEEKRSINVAEPFARQAIGDVLDSCTAGVHANSRAKFKASLNTWMKSLLSEDIAVADTVFIRLHELSKSGALAESRNQNIAPDIYAPMKRLITEGAALLEKVNEQQRERVLDASHVLLARMRWMQPAERSEMLLPLVSKLDDKEMSHVLDGMLNRKMQAFFDDVTDYIDHLPDYLPKKISDASLHPFIEGLAEKNSSELLTVLFKSPSLYKVADTVYNSLIPGLAPDRQSLFITSINDAAEVRKNRVLEEKRRTSPRLAVEAVLTILQDVPQKEKNEIAEHMIRAGLGLGESRGSAVPTAQSTKANSEEDNAEDVTQLADAPMDNEFFSALVAARNVQDAASAYVGLAIAGSTRQTGHSDKEQKEPQTLQDHLAKAGATLSECCKDISQPQRAALACAIYQAVTYKQDLLPQDGKNTQVFVQQPRRQNIEALISADTMNAFKKLRECIAELPLDTALSSCAKEAYQATLDNQSMLQELQTSGYFACTGATTTVARLSPEDAPAVNYNIRPQTFWDIRTAADYLTRVKTNSLDIEKEPSPLLKAALLVAYDIQHTQAVDNTTDQRQRYFADVVNAPDSDLARMVPTPLMRHSLYLAIKEFAPEGIPIERNAPFWDVPKELVSAVQDRFSDLANQSIKRGLNPASFADENDPLAGDYNDSFTSFAGKVAVSCNRFMEADGSVSRALEAVGANYPEAQRHIASFAQVFIEPASVNTFRKELSNNLVQRFAGALPEGVSADNATAEQWAKCVAAECRSLSWGTKNEMLDTLTMISRATSVRHLDTIADVQQGFSEAVTRMLGATANSTNEAKEEAARARILWREQGQRDPMEDYVQPLTGYTASDLHLARDEIEAQKQDMEVLARQERVLERQSQAEASVPAHAF